VARRHPCTRSPSGRRNLGVASSHFPRLGAAASVICVPREGSSARGHLAMPALATAQRNRQPTGLFVRVRGAEPHRAARARSRRQAETDGPHKRATDRECRGSAGGAWTVRLSEPDWSGFLPPPPRSVHAVLPHTAHQRPSPPAFGFFPPGLVGPGSDDGSVEGDQPHAVGRPVGHGREAVAGCALVAFGHEQRQSPERVARPPYPVLVDSALRRAPAAGE
jgi:hypothetical protein